MKSNPNHTRSSILNHGVALLRSCAWAVALAAPALPALAQTQYSDRTAFNAAVGTHYDYDFNTDGLVTTLSSGVGNLAGVSTVGGDATGRASGGTLWGSTAGAPDAFTTVRFTFLQPVYSFGFDDMDLNGAEWAIIDVNFAGGGSTRYAVTTLTPFDPVFFGISASQGLVSVDVYSDDTAAGLLPGSRANLIDNVSISVTPVPEASSLSLMALGLLGLGALRRTRTRH